MTEKIRGIVEQVSRKEKDGQYGKFTQLGVKIGNKWYNGGKKKDWDDCEAGDEVQLAYSTNEKNGKTYLNIENITNLGKPEAPQTAQDAPKIQDNGTKHPSPLSVEGEIENEYSREYEGKNGPYTKDFIKAGGRVYSGFRTERWGTYKVGDIVRIALEEKNGYRNIASVEVLESATEEQSRQLRNEIKDEERDDKRRMARCNALTHADARLAIIYQGKAQPFSPAEKIDLGKEHLKIAEECEEFIYRGMEKPKLKDLGQAVKEAKEEPIEATL